MRRWLTGTTLAGAWLGVGTRLQAADAWTVALAALSLALACRCEDVRRAAILITVCAAMAAHASNARDRVLEPAVSQLVPAWRPDAPDATARPGAPVTLRGVLAEDATPVAAGVRLLLDVEQAHHDGQWRQVSGRVQVHVAGSLAGPHVAGWTRGRRLQAPVLLRRLQTSRNPGGADPQRQALGRRFTLAGTIKSAALVDVTPGPWWHEAAAGVRAHVRRQADRWIAPIDPVSAAVVTAILIGDRAGLPDETTKRLQAAGTYHVIAISGGNVALIVLIGLGIARLTIGGSRPRMLTALALVAAYGWIVGGDPSVSRAVVAASVYLGCRAVGLAAAPMDVLGVVVLILLAADPLLVIDVGAWLSFGAVLGILLAAGPLAAWLVRPTTGRRSRPRLVLQATAALFSATVAAELVLLPVNASIFSRLGVAGLLLNFIAIPAMAFVQCAGLLLVVVGGWWDGAAVIAAWTAHVAVIALVGSAALVDLAPWMSWRVPPPSVTVVATFYAAGALILTGVLVRWGPRLAAAGIAAASAGIIVTAPALERAAPAPGWLRATMLDVGQGESLLVQFPTGQSLLVDAGGVPGGFDVGGRVVVPALWALGVRRLDWLAFTHADLDHADGAVSVADILRPREIWEGTPVPADARRQALRDLAGARGIAWRRLQQGDALEIGGAELVVLHPPPPDWERQRVRNDDSLVIRVRYGEVDLLLTGDIGRATEAVLPVESDPAPRLRVLKVAHHGSRTSTSAGFLGEFVPRVALVSAGRSNLFGHPAPDVTSRLAQAGAALFRTDRDGAVRVETDGHDVRIETMAGERRLFSLWPWRGGGARGGEPMPNAPAP